MRREKRCQGTPDRSVRRLIPLKDHQPPAGDPKERCAKVFKQERDLLPNTSCPVSFLTASCAVSKVFNSEMWEEDGIEARFLGVKL